MTAARDRDELDDLAEALADGQPIDWARESARLAARRKRLASLELLSEIGNAFRRAAGEAEAREGHQDRAERGASDDRR